jgi:hypothetical protein
VRVTAITRPVLCAHDHQETSIEPVDRLVTGIDVHKEDAGGSDPSADWQAGRIREAEVRHDRRGDPAFAEFGWGLKA